MDDTMAKLVRFIDNEELRVRRVQETSHRKEKLLMTKRLNMLRTLREFVEQLANEGISPE